MDNMIQNTQRVYGLCLLAAHVSLFLSDNLPTKQAYSVFDRVRNLPYLYRADTRILPYATRGEQNMSAIFAEI